MLKFELVQTDKHSIKILLRRKNLRFLRRTNLIQTVGRKYHEKYNLHNNFNNSDKLFNVKKYRT